MSTYMYLECLEHDPPIRSDSEVGQHTYDLRDIQEYVARREELVSIHEMESVVSLNETGTRWPNTAMYFFAQHPKCRIRIVDEYGRLYPLTPNEPIKTAEQKARDLLERMGIEDAQSFTAGDLVELANLIARDGKL